jgi:hypothetical protein
MAASFSPTRGTTKMVDGKILELTDFFKKTTIKRIMTVDG